MPDATANQTPRLLDEFRKVLPLHHYSIHRALLCEVDRTVRPFPRYASRADLFPAEPEIESFMTDLAVNGNVAAATQNQAIRRAADW